MTTTFDVNKALSGKTIIETWFTNQSINFRFSDGTTCQVSIRKDTTHGFFVFIPTPCN